MMQEQGLGSLTPQELQNVVELVKDGGFIDIKAARGKNLADTKVVQKARKEEEQEEEEEEEEEGEKRRRQTN